jgi:hypothetical protein
MARADDVKAVRNPTSAAALSTPNAKATSVLLSTTNDSIGIGIVNSTCDKLHAAGIFTCTSRWESGAVGDIADESIDRVRSAMDKEKGEWVVAQDSELVIPLYDYSADPTPRSFTGRFSFENSIGLFAVTNTLADKRNRNVASTLRTPRRSLRTPSRVNVVGSALGAKASNASRSDEGVTSNIPLDQLRIADDFSQGNATSRTLVVQHRTPDLGSLSAYAGGCQRACRDSTNFYFAASGSNVTIYVIDTPVADHVQFKQVQTGESRLVVEEYLSPSAADATADGATCVRDLGTHVAAAAAGFEFGTAKDADIVSVGVRPGCGGTARVSDLLAGLDWIHAHHSANVAPDSAVAIIPYVISAQDPASEALKRSIDSLVASGVSFAVAAGDLHQDACGFVPANMDNVITVGGVEVDESSVSARPWAWSNFDKCVDVFAPAVRVRSASPECFECTASLSRTGTAAARVAGIMAQFIQTNTNASGADVKTAILEGATRQLIQNPQFPYRQTTRSVAQSLLNLDVFEVRDVV